MNKFLLKKYIAIVACLIGSFSIISFAAVVSHNFTVAGQTALATPGELAPGNNGQDRDYNYNYVEQAPPEPTHPNINVLMLGLDEGNLPDSIFLVMFDGATNMLDIVSIPRDTQVTMSQTERDMFAEIGRSFPNHGVIKINELHSWAGSAHGYRLVTHHLETMLEIEIDYHIILDIDTFKYVVDAVGGIYMDIPRRLFYRGRQREDGTWDAGTINVDIPAGRQRLNGAMAEQVIRFRQFADGDLGRITLHQNFMQAFFTQVLNDEVIMNNLPGLANSVLGRVRTDIGLVSLISYVGIADDLDTESIEFHMLPGHAGMARDPGGLNRSWFFVDLPEARQLIEQIYEDNATLAAQRAAGQ